MYKTLLERKAGRDICNESVICYDIGEVVSCQ